MRILQIESGLFPDEETIHKAIKDWEETTAHRNHNQAWEDPNGYGY